MTSSRQVPAEAKAVALKKALPEDNQPALPAEPLPSNSAKLSSSKQIVRDVVRGLYESRYVARQRLAEPDLMRGYSVSRGSVREAIHPLAAEGVVAVHQYRGAYIRQLPTLQRETRS
jgi:DNA-binding GntR family transcriptional regulator